MLLKRLTATAALMVLTALPATAETKPLPLAPVPYELLLPAEITSHLSTEPLTGPWAEEPVTAGAVASTLVMYTPETGQKSILMGVYYFPEAKFDAAQNPDEPPPFGKAVIREGGMVLSIAGPQDTIFDPETQDGKNVVAASGLVYAPETYRKAP
jgi:hypothetical protein